MSGIAALIVSGALLEAAGILLVVFDLWADRRQARAFASDRLSWGTQRAFDDIEQSMPFTRLTRGSSERVDDEIYRRDEILAEVLTRVLGGDLWRRALGVALLLVGLGLSTAGNLWGAA